MSRLAASLLLAGLLTLGGCIRLERSYPEPTTYAFEAIRPGSLPAAETGAALRVRRLDISPRFAGKEFVYRTDELVYERDYYHRFLVAPEKLVTEQVTAWLAASGLFRVVGAAPGQLVPELVLEGTVSELYGDFRPNPPRAVLAVTLMVLGGGAVREMVVNGSYREEIPLRSSQPQALVEGWSTALANALATFEGELRRSLTSAASVAPPQRRPGPVPEE